MIKITSPKVLNKPIAQSVALHIVLLTILALISFKPVTEQLWHSFEWDYERENTPQGPAALPDQGSITESVNNPDIERAKDPVTAEPVSQTTATNQVSSVVPTVEEVVQSPIQSSQERVQSTTSLPNRGRISSNSSISGSGSNDGFELTGDGVEIIRKTLPQLRETDHGILVLRFKLDANGRIRMNEVETVQFSSTDQYNATLLALRSWQFRFLGRYNPDQIYQIKFKFSPRNR